MRQQGKDRAESVSDIILLMVWWAKEERGEEQIKWVKMDAEELNLIKWDRENRK